MNLEERFWSKVDQTGDCWLWTHATRRGYGRFRLDGRNRLAHQVAWELTNGPIPLGRYVDHPITCPKICVNPQHLRLVTHKQNMENQAGAHVNSRSGVRGVWRQDNRWKAVVGHNGRQIYLGLYQTIEEAEAVVVTKRNELFTHNDADRS